MRHGFLRRAKIPAIGQRFARRKVRSAGERFHHIVRIIHFRPRSSSHAVAVPARLGGVNVPSRVLLPIRFQLRDRL